ncbi:MAG: hypothetical protein ABL936_00200 [Aestuariivirga sp.]
MFDHNLSPRLARALQEIFKGDHIIQTVRDRFPTSIKDIDLFKQLSQDGHWVLISGDRRITKLRAERDAFRSSKLIGFFLSPGLYKAPETKKLERILALWSTMETSAQSVQPGAMYELPMKSNRVKQLKY